jgi:hypothetical protein
VFFSSMAGRVMPRRYSARYNQKSSGILRISRMMTSSPDLSYFFFYISNDFSYRSTSMMAREN